MKWYILYYHNCDNDSKVILNVMINCCDVIGNTFGILMSETIEHFKIITKII